MDLKVIKELINYLKQNELSEITYRSGEDEVTLKQSLVGSENTFGPINHTDDKGISTDNDQSYTVNSPLVGVFYAAKSPQDDPFVKVGTKVKAGDLIGIIEAMKVMTEIKSDRPGVVSKIMVNNGEEVEYDEPLIQIE
ncbi:acetyl-CoA carboxylase biotin carboxyl carrier protein subunit [Nicoliella spurrieriana]|uniref:Biotin carboxyl carrier protein of acetyl-CoA carboxylase n=1 Tax=Nicoliella spurrieriana TaxID=2925830 RepID=A0A976RRU2_9LACO|nr:biotin/lipoyl-containing protein [Nicoliella spurrieriana]UQS86591.1 acetyl-CoA carboxylase biotin carboxyl carrier protein subunit [Nicoliella spurrieriana]